ncbi:Uncharacterized protein dnm_020590 [Desulfonema magnum]|uniref:Uncharacterized protein n=1 Tax=Desulfonema magnum TaxID=45655 RepID=A0A975BIG5_9BACT|nr:Uncharacterized protein dnm_020590 [Desulfonema magnum]
MEIFVSSETAVFSGMPARRFVKTENRRQISEIGANFSRGRKTEYFGRGCKPRPAKTPRPAKN